jgi:hypothetical protein
MDTEMRTRITHAYVRVHACATSMYRRGREWQALRDGARPSVNFVSSPMAVTSRMVYVAAFKLKKTKKNGKINCTSLGL